MADSLLLPLGEVIAWKCAGTTQAGLVAALKAAGLDASIARELAPRNAFSRALKKLDDSRVIRQTAEDSKSISFQFTRESKVGGEFQYALETLLVLDKHSGRIDCPHEQLAGAAREELDKAFENRTAADVTGIVQKILERNGDLFSIRPQGGCYFVPQRHAGLIDQVQRFLGGIDGTVVRFAVSQGDPETERSIRDSVAAGLAGLIAEHEAAVAEFGADTRPDTIKRAAEKIRTARFKVEAYAALLGDQKARLETSLAAAAEKLRVQVLGRQFVGGVAEEPFDADAQGLEGVVLQPVADADAIFGTPFHGPDDERLLAVLRNVARGTEQQEEATKVFTGFKARTRSSGLVEDRGEIDFVVSLEPALMRAELARNEPPDAAIGEDAERLSTPIEVPFNLLGWVFSLPTDADLTVEQEVPFLGVGDECGRLPKVLRFAPVRQGRIEIGICEKEGIVGLAAIEEGLIFQLPSQSLHHGLDETVFQSLFIAVLLNSIAFRFPELVELRQDIGRFLASLFPFGLKCKMMFEPMTGENPAIADRREEVAGIDACHRLTRNEEAIAYHGALTASKRIILSSRTLRKVVREIRRESHSLR